MVKFRWVKIILAVLLVVSQMWIVKIGTASADEGSGGVVVAVSAGASFSLLLKNDGTVVAQGYSPDGRAKVPDGLSNVIAVSAGSSHSLALKDDGTVVAWGNNSGHAATVPEELSGVRVKAISAGTQISVALTEDGKVVQWGDNISVAVPDGLPAIKAISAGSDHVIALEEDGTIVAWGVDGYWKQSSVPSRLENKKAKAVSAGNTYNLVLLDDGTIDAWGIPNYGQATIPNELKSKKFKAISAGSSHAMAIEEDGTLVTWGDASVKMPTDAANILSVDAGDHLTIALKTDGTVVGGDSNNNFYGAIPTPPEFIVGYPVLAVASAIETSIELKLNKAGTAFYVALPGGAAAPTVEQVRAGADDAGNAVSKAGELFLGAQTVDAIRISGLEAGESYDVYIMIQDRIASPGSIPALVSLTIGPLSGVIEAANAAKDNGSTAQTAYVAAGGDTAAAEYAAVEAALTALQAALEAAPQVKADIESATAALNDAIAELEAATTALEEQAAIEAANTAKDNGSTAQTAYITAGGDTTSAEYAAVEAELTALQAALETTPQVKADIESATAALNVAIIALETATMELEEQAAIKAANAAKDNGSEAQAAYIAAGGETTSAEYAALEAALTALQAALEAAPQVKVDIESATAVLNNAIAELEAATTELEEQAAIEAANAAKDNGSTAQTAFVAAGGDTTAAEYAAVEAALTALQAALEAAPQVKADIESATAALNDAIAELEAVTAGLVAVTGVTLDPNTLTLTAGGATATLSATITPENATNRVLTWTSSNTSIATVDSNGVITPLAAGIVEITVTTANGGKMATSTVTVNPAAPATIPDSPTTPSKPVADSTSVDVLINGKAENTGTATTTIIDNRTVTTIAVNQKKLEDRLAVAGQNAIVTIPVNTESEIVIGELNGQMVKNMEDKLTVLEIKTGQAAYAIPAQQININAILGQIGQSAILEDIKVQVEISASTMDMAKVVENAAVNGEFTVVVPTLSFTVRAVYGDTTIEVSKFDAYVERTIAIPDRVDPNKITTGVVVEPDGSVRHVPTKIVVIDGKYFAKVNSLTNSTYSVVWRPLEFSDMVNHWAKDAVNDMGSRMVIDGTGKSLFSPDRDITRAEFAAIIVRGLGLKLENGTTPFSDVKVSDWYHSAINTANAFQLISGFEDGSFRPNDKITREQAMIILSKAMVITGLKAKLSDQSADATLLPFGDAAKVSAWAQGSVADSVQAGIISGKSAAKLAPKDFITRAEVATIIQRLLQKSGLI